MTTGAIFEATAIVVLFAGGNVATTTALVDVGTAAIFAVWLEAVLAADAA